MEEELCKSGSSKHSEAGTQMARKNTVEKAAMLLLYKAYCKLYKRTPACTCLLLTAGRRKPRRGVAHSISADRPSRRASLQAHASKSSTTQLRDGNKKGEGKIPLKTQSSGFRPPQDPSSIRVVARSISADRSLRRRTSLQVHASAWPGGLDYSD